MGTLWSRLRGLPRPRATRSKAAALLALVVTSVVACSGRSTLAGAPSSAQSQAPALDGSGWTVVSLNGAEVPTDAHIELHFAGGRLTGNSGCNAFNSDYSQQGSSLRISELASTRIACPAPAGSREQALYAGLPAIVTAAIVNDRLQLLDATGLVRVVSTRHAGDR